MPIRELGNTTSGAVVTENIPVEISGAATGNDHAETIEQCNSAYSLKQNEKMGMPWELGSLNRHLCHIFVGQDHSVLIKNFGGDYYYILSWKNGRSMRTPVVLAKVSSERYPLITDKFVAFEMDGDNASLIKDRDILTLSQTYTAKNDDEPVRYVIIPVDQHEQYINREKMVETDILSVMQELSNGGIVRSWICNELENPISTLSGVYQVDVWANPVKRPANNKCPFTIDHAVKMVINKAREVAGSEGLEGRNVEIIFAFNDLEFMEKNAAIVAKLSARSREELKGLGVKDVNAASNFIGGPSEDKKTRFSSDEQSVKLFFLMKKKTPQKEFSRSENN